MSYLLRSLAFGLLLLLLRLLGARRCRGAGRLRRDGVGGGNVRLLLAVPVQVLLRLRVVEVLQRKRATH